jgi:hypothetical protein
MAKINKKHKHELKRKKKRKLEQKKRSSKINGGGIWDPDKIQMNKILWYKLLVK